MPGPASWRLVLPYSAILTGDVIVVAMSVFVSYLLRFSFSIPPQEMEPLPFILAYIIFIRICCYAVGKSYSGILKFFSFLDILKAYLITIAGSFLLLLTNLISYYLVNEKLFIPLTIVIIEFIITSLLMILFRSTIRVAYGKRSPKNSIEKIRGE